MNIQVMRLLFIACVFLAGCGEYKCIEGRIAYRLNDAWVIPSDAYHCVEYKP